MRRSAPRCLSQLAISAATFGATAVNSLSGIAGNLAPRPLPFLNRPESAQTHLMARRVVDVLVPVALDRAYSYRVPDGLDLVPGDIVCVPLGARDATAVVW